MKAYNVTLLTVIPNCKNGGFDEQITIFADTPEFAKKSAEYIRRRKELNMVCDYDVKLLKLEEVK